MSASIEVSGLAADPFGVLPNTVKDGVFTQPMPLFLCWKPLGLSRTTGYALSP